MALESLLKNSYKEQEEEDLMNSSFFEPLKSEEEEEDEEEEDEYSMLPEEIKKELIKYNKQTVEQTEEDTSEYSMLTDEIKNELIGYSTSEKEMSDVPPSYQSEIDEPTGTELAELGARLEKTTFRNLYQIFKAGNLSADNDKSLSENIKDVEKERTDKIYSKMKEKYGTDFRKYQDEMAVIGGRAGVALFDPVTFLIPWAKIAKVGKLGATGIGAGIASTDMAIYDYATHGEVSPDNVLFAAGLGGLSSLGGTILANKIYAPKDKNINLGKIDGETTVVKSSITEPPNPKLNTKEAQDLEDVSLKVIAENDPLLKELSNLGAVRKLMDRANKDINIYNDTVKGLNKIKGVANVKINKTIKQNFEDAKKFKKEQLPQLIKKHSDGQLKIVDGVLTKLGKDDQYEITQNILHSITQNLTGSLMGGGAGYTIGSFIGDDDSETLPISFMTAGVVLGGFHKSVNRNPYITEAMKKETSDSILNNAKIVLHNFLKVNTAGGIATRNIAHGGENETLARMLFHIQGGRKKNIIGAEQATDLVSGKFYLQIGEVLGNSSVHEQSAAFKIIRGLDTEENVIKSFNLNKTEIANVKTLVRNVENFKKDFGQAYVRSAGIEFKNIPNSEGIYGLPQFYNNNIIKDSKAFKKTLKEAIVLQNKDKNLTSKQLKKKADDIFDNMTGRGIKNILGEDEKFTGIPYLKNFEKERYFTDLDAIKKLEPFLEDNLNIVLNQWVTSSVKGVEFARQFGQRGEVVTSLMKSLKNKNNKGILNDVEYKKKLTLMRDTVNAYFKTHGVLKGDHDLGRTGMSLLTFLTNTTMLPRAAIAQLADFIQPFQNSTFGSAAKAILKGQGDRNYAYKLGIARGKNTTLEKDMEALVSSAGNAHNNVQLRINKYTQNFFKWNQMQRLTDKGARFAFNTGVEDAFKFGKKYGTKTKVNRSTMTKINQMGLDKNELKYLSKFKTIDDAFKDKAAEGILLKAGNKIKDRDIGVPTVGNRMLFSQSQNPYVRSFGLFLSWTQFKSSQLNSLINRVSDGDTKLALKMLGGIGVAGGIRELQIFASPAQEYYKDNKPDRFSGKWWEQAAMLQGMVDWRLEKAIRVFGLGEAGGKSGVENFSSVIGQIDNLATGVSGTVRNFGQGDYEGALIAATKPTPIRELISVYNRAIVGEARDPFGTGTLEDTPSTVRKSSVAYAEGGRVELAEGGDPEDRNNMYAGESFFETTRPSLRAILEKRNEVIDEQRKTDTGT
jgi:hypothetical protein|tara:strand:- start:74 stop:3793 length:3720 start_codon:yes stop_codon:yes gene_type:complete